MVRTNWSWVLCSVDNVLSMKIRLLFLFFFFLQFFSFGQFWKVTDVTKMGAEINSGAEENIPVFRSGYNELYFVRTFDKANRGDENDQDIWFSKWNEGSYESSRSLTALNNKLNNAVLGFTNNGNRIFLLDSYEGKKDLVKGISYSDFENDSWKTPVELPIPELSIKGDFYGFHVSGNENVIVLSFNGDGSLGQEDLYVSIKQDGNWSKPMHLGPVLNTAGFEISPFLSVTGDTLFFSSDGLGGEGDADIFYSIKGDDWTEWSAPKNLGKPFNSYGFDAYFTIYNEKAYWSSNRDAEESDIYSALIVYPPPLEAKCMVTDLSTYNGRDGSCEVQVISAADPVSYIWNTGSNENRINNLPAGAYRVTVRDDAGQSLDLECYVTGPVQPLDPIEVKQFENLNWIHYFGYNKSKLSLGNRDLKKFLEEIESQLDAGRSTVTLKIRSSASHVPTKSFPSNEELAKERSENLKYDLIDHFSTSKYNGKVNVVIVSSIVDGPVYENDGVRKKKYEPFQFVSLTLE